MALHADGIVEGRAEYCGSFESSCIARLGETKLKVSKELSKILFRMEGTSFLRSIEKSWNVKKRSCF